MEKPQHSFCKSAITATRKAFQVETYCLPRSDPNRQLFTYHLAGPSSCGHIYPRRGSVWAGDFGSAVVAAIYGILAKLKLIDSINHRFE